MSFPPPDPAHEVAVQPVPAELPVRSAARPNGAARPGDLAPAWRVMLGIGWICAFFAYAGMWQASVQIGVSTWWIGPRGQPTHVAIKLIPFYLSLVVGLLIVYNVRWIVRWSAVGVAATALISIPDFSRSIGLGVAEAVIAVLLGVITLASLSGRYRAVQSEPIGSAAPQPPPLDPASR